MAARPTATRPFRLRRNRQMTVRYEDDLRLFRSRQLQVAMLGLLVLYLIVPRSLSEFWLLVLNYAGVAAIGAIGLNLLTGYTGQVSLGHAFFVGTGAYCASWFGVHHGLPIYAWLPLAALIGGVLGALIGPAALRLRGDYLVIITLGLVFLGEHIFNNWESVTGGGTGVGSAAPVKIGGLDFAHLSIGGQVYSRNQSLFWLIWAVVGIVALLAKNLVRSRPGRAMQAVRDRDVAAEVIGVSLFRYKVGAFAVSSAMAAVAGALYGVVQQFVSPGEWNIFLSIQYIAIIIVGGVGTIFGAVLGALFLGGIPQIIKHYSASIPLVSTGPADHGLISVFALNQVIYGLLIVLFLMAEPLGLAAVWLRIKAYFKTWPFSY